MQRSQVKQFKASSSTVFQSTFLGTHSLLAIKQPSPGSESQPFTSRMAHLPDHYAELLSEPKIVIVFQAIEIERLTTEVLLLRGKLREREGHLINANSYEVQIKELVQRCNKIQNQKYSYQQELAQTKDMNDMLYNELTQLKTRYEEVDISASEKYKLEKARNQELMLEIEKWKGRYTLLDKAKGEEADAARKTLELQRQSQISNGTKELLAKFQIEREQLLGKLREKRQEVSEKDLELKKLGNLYQQTQVRLQQQESSIESYEQKVVMLSQETYRLSELLRIKAEEIKNIKMSNEHDLSLKLSQITIMDETKNKLNSKLKTIQETNQQLRQALKNAQNYTAKLKTKALEAQRLQFQIKQLRKQAENKVKMMERKDRKILLLEEEVNNLKQLQSELFLVKKFNKEHEKRIQVLQEKIQEKIQQLRQVKAKFSQLQKGCIEQVSNLSSKAKQYERLYETVQSNYKILQQSSAQVQQKSSYLQLQARQASVNLKQKDYTISSLRNQLKQLQNQIINSDDYHSSAIQQLQEEFSKERQKLEIKVRDSQIKKRQIEMATKQTQSRSRQNQLRFKEYQCRFKEIAMKCQDQQRLNNRKEQQIHQLKATISKLIQLQHQLNEKQTLMSSELKNFYFRLNRIEQIIASLRNNLVQRYRAAQENQQRLKKTQFRIDDLHQWLAKTTQKMNQSLEQSFSFSPSKRDSQNSLSPPKARPFYSPEVTPTYQTYAQSKSIYGLQDLQSDNTNASSSSPRELPIEWMIRFVLLCAQVESLRKKVGDKQAKVESMRSSIVSKNNSGSNLANNLHSSNSSSQSGFFTARENKVNRKDNIYY